MIMEMHICIHTCDFQGLVTTGSNWLERRAEEELKSVDARLTRGSDGGNESGQVYICTVPDRRSGPLGRKACRRLITNLSR